METCNRAQGPKKPESSGKCSSQTRYLITKQVDESWNVKVCDFGLSRFTDSENMSTLGKLRGTFAYCAPEVYFGER